MDLLGCGKAVFTLHDKGKAVQKGLQRELQKAAQKGLHRPTFQTKPPLARFIIGISFACF